MPLYAFGHCQTTTSLTLLVSVEFLNTSYVTMPGGIFSSVVVTLLFDRLDKFYDATSVLDPLEVALVMDLCLQCVNAMANKQREKALQALFQFLPLNDVVFAFQLPYTIGIFVLVFFGVFHMQDDRLPWVLC